VTFPLRLPDDLHERVKQISAAEYRPMNKQLEMWVQAAVERYEREHPTPAERGRKDADR
jgi:hypothetical protein